MGSTKRTGDGAAVTGRTKTSCDVHSTEKSPHDNSDDPYSLETLVREALDPEKLSKLDLLTTTLGTFNTSDEDVGRLLQLLLVDGGVIAAMKSENKKRILNMLLKVKWAGRGKME